MPDDNWSPVGVRGVFGRSPIVLACEHASRHIPVELNNLGLDEAARISHAAWDPGALHVAERLSDLLKAPLIFGGVSRLVYDCNRPPEASDCIPARSEIFEIPGNAALTDQEKDRRFAIVHEPFHTTLANAITQQQRALAEPVVLVTVHSFTPVYHGERRSVEIGYLYDTRSDLSEAACTTEQSKGRYSAALNEPYGPGDGVTYTLRKHAEVLGLSSTMIEIRNDLILTQEAAHSMASHLAGVLRTALASLSRSQEGRSTS